MFNAPPPPHAEPVKYQQWGEGLEHDAVMQMEKACLLPVAVAGALMPDAHVDCGERGDPLRRGRGHIACRMKMTMRDIPLRDLE